VEASLQRRGIHLSIKSGVPHDRFLTNLREAWAKRKYEAHFVSKLTDSDGENAEIDTWLDFAYGCGY
jgi:23S rRNA-intervening sequence protein